MTSSLSRMLFVAAVLAATFFGGYLMGGAPNMFTGHHPRGESDALTMPALQDDPGLRVGHAERMGESQFGDVKRQPWTKERLLKVARNLLGEANELAAIRPISHLADQLEAGDFPMALEAAKEFADRGERDVFRGLMLMRWAELNPRAAAAYLAAETGDGPTFDSLAAQIVFPAWAHQDAVGAAAWARDLKDAGKRKQALEQIVREVAARDSDGAAAFAQAHAAEVLVDGKLPTAFQAWEKRPPEEAAKRLAAAEQTDELSAPVRRWAEKDRQAAWTWAQALRDPAQRAAALNGVFAVWGEKDYAGAAAAYAQLDQPSGALKDAGRRIVDAWPKKEFAAAQGWVEKLPAGEARDLALVGLVNRWTDAPETAKWLDTLPASPGRDAAVARYAEVVSEKDGAQAMDWVIGVDDPMTRQNAFLRVAQQWSRRDPQAWFDWMLSDDNLTAGEKQALMRGE